MQNFKDICEKLTVVGLLACVLTFSFPLSPVQAHYLDCHSGGVCILPATNDRLIFRYFAPDKQRAHFLEIDGMKQIQCNDAQVGDPAYGQRKQCGFHKVDSVPKESWKNCAKEGQRCDVQLAAQNKKLNTGKRRFDVSWEGYVRRVRYGTGKTWVYRYVDGNFDCKNATLGTNVDPAPGKAKTCQISSKQIKSRWKNCGKEGTSSCRTKNGVYLVRYSNGDRSRSFVRVVSGSTIDCSNRTFNDPAPGQAKYCDFAEHQLFAEYNNTRPQLISDNTSGANPMNGTGTVDAWCQVQGLQWINHAKRRAPRPDDWKSCYDRVSTCKASLKKRRDKVPNMTCGKYTLNYQDFRRIICLTNLKNGKKRRDCLAISNRANAEYNCDSLTEIQLERAGGPDKCVSFFMSN
ncbi:MAG: hypothetical protein ACI9JL_003991 [Paracoccaceae bacterium]|jgi:hypothetical protein